MKNHIREIILMVGGPSAPGDGLFWPAVRALCLLSFLILIMSPAIAGDSDVDAVGRVDTEGTTGAPVRTLSASFDLQIAPGEWPACRSAAVAGQASFDAWIASSGKSAEVKVFYAAMPPAWKDAVRRAALGLAP